MHTTPEPTRRTATVRIARREAAKRARRSRSMVAATAAFSIALLGTGIALPHVAAAAPAPAAPTNSYTSAGATFSGVVPDGVCSVRATVLGGAGGSGSASGNGEIPSPSGAGARIAATFAVLPGEAFSGSVGGGGAQSRLAGANGGGLGGSVTDAHPGAGGGGYSAFSLGGQPAIVAGGGGGTGGGHPTNGETGRGGDAGLPAATGVANGAAGANGQDIPLETTVGGGTGGSTVGGAGGVNSASSALNGGSGASLQGGNGAHDPNYDAGGGGGGGYFGGGAGAATVERDAAGGIRVSGGGGGGGSSFVAGALALLGGTVGAEDVESSAGDRRVTQGNGANGSVSLDWIECDYDLAVTKSVSDDEPVIGDTIEWTIEVVNNGDSWMTRGDTVTIADSLPGAGAKTITGISATGGTNALLERGAITCDAAVGAPMPASLSCSRPFEVIGQPASGVRGLDVGETLEITYEQEVTDSLGTVLVNTATVTDRGLAGDNSSTATSTVTADPPVAADDADLLNEIGTVVTIDVLGNDTPGTGAFVPGSVTLVDALGTPIASPYVVPGEGTWTVDGTTGAITFTPEAGFLLDPTPVDYRVTDVHGLTATATVTVTYVPLAVDDASHGNTVGSSVTVPVLANDTGDFDASSVRIIDPVTNASLTQRVVPGEGTWVVDTTTGAITFTPAAGYTGNPTPIDYRVTDITGDVVEATVTVSYLPVATNDVSRGNQPGTAVTVDVIGNDTGVFDPTSVMLIDPVSGDRVRSLRVPGEGTWTVNAVTGAITFTPEAGFRGNPTPVEYEVTDLSGNTTTALVEITYLVPPVAGLPVLGAEMLPVLAGGAGAMLLGGILLALARRRGIRGIERHTA